MKISQIIYTGFGGLGSVAFSLVNADAERKHQWSIGFAGDLPIDESYTKRSQEANVDYDVFRSSPGHPYKAWCNLYRWLELIKPDAIICHSINSILPCRLHAWKRQIPLVAVEHTANQVKTRNDWIFSRLSMLLADKVIALTPEYQVELKNSHGRLFRAEKVTVVPNGIDTSQFRPAEAQPLISANRIVLGMAARFSFSKRQDLLISILERLAELRPSLTVELRLAGDGSEIDRVKSLSQSSPVGSRIRFEGLLSENEIAPWLRDLDIYVHATEGETLSTSLLQAMATGLPIVASDIPGVSNLLQSDGDYGICVPNDANRFADAILSYIDNPENAASFGCRARARIEEHYSCTTMLQRYLNTISEAAHKK